MQSRATSAKNTKQQICRSVASSTAIETGEAVQKMSKSYRLSSLIRQNIVNKLYHRHIAVGDFSLNSLQNALCLPKRL